MNNYLHKTNKGELPMYELIAILYKTTVAIFLLVVVFLLTN